MQKIILLVLTILLISMGICLRPPAVQAGNCTWVCKKEICERPPGGLLRCTCIKWGRECSGGDDDPDEPPALAAALDCSRPGENEWCAGSLTLLVTATEPQNKTVTISGTAGGETFTCSGTGEAACSVSLPQGFGVAEYTALSTTGKSRSASLAWKRDSQPPLAELRLTGQTGANGWYVSSVYAAPEASDDLSGLAACQQSLNDSGWGACGDLVLTDGVHSLRLQAVDAAGNLREAARSLQVDTGAPALDISLPPVDGQQGWYVSPVSVGAQAADAISGLERVEISHDDGQSWQPLPLVLEDGFWPLRLRALDQAGNVSSLERQIQVDTRPPESQFWSHAEGEPVSGLVQLSGQTADALSGPACGELSLDGGQTWQPLALSGSPAAWSAPWDTFAVPNGSYLLLMRAADAAGNRENTARLNLVVGNAPPEVALTKSWALPDSGKLRVSANGIPVGSVTLSIRAPQGGQAASFEYKPGKSTVVWDGRLQDGSLAPAGTYPVRARACDLFDNCRTAHGSITVAYAFLPPTVVPTPSPVPSLTAVQVVTPKPRPTGAPAVQLPPPRGGLPPAPQSPPVPPPLWPRLTLGGLVLCFAVLLLSDPRPAALRALVRALQPNLIKE
jgi:hypothetical protein